ncbi:hypothetical protein JR316_0001619 [Psilocybe cubensis]|uniref:Uncharacterized protein n=2 Tax=Psilocybe cubensis TaxID=181762 RepID=A0ACB8HA80_PSICU|nr:hypothetical protein JR316_0001619 [Psilocybe cubensis]KAH9484719.1 hypothetical protein JR316_0001619 [Psilocybe cubensis]
MTNHLSSEAAQVIGLFVEATLYGVYIVSFGFLLFYILFAESPKRRWRWPTGMRAVTLAVAVILAINSTLNLSLGLRRMMQTYVYKTESQGPTWIDLAKPYTVTLQTLIADIFLTYRCWVVYGKIWTVAIFPISLSLGSLALYTWTMVMQTQITLNGSVTVEFKASRILAPLYIAQFALTTALNIYTTSFIVYRIAKMDRAIPHSQSSTTCSAQSGTHLGHDYPDQLKHVSRIVIDSAIIYTAVCVMTFASYKSSVQYITSAVDIIAIGIVFNMIVIRLALERSRAQRCQSKGTLSTLKFDSFPNPQESASSSTDTRSLNTMKFSPGSDADSASNIMETEKDEDRNDV